MAGAPKASWPLSKRPTSVPEARAPAPPSCCPPTADAEPPLCAWLSERGRGAVSVAGIWDSRILRSPTHGLTKGVRKPTRSTPARPRPIPDGAWPDVPGDEAAPCLLGSARAGNKRPVRCLSSATCPAFSCLWLVTPLLKMTPLRGADVLPGFQGPEAVTGPRENRVLGGFCSGVRHGDVGLMVP